MARDRRLIAPWKVGVPMLPAHPATASWKCGFMAAACASNTARSVMRCSGLADPRALLLIRISIATELVTRRCASIVASSVSSGAFKNVLSSFLSSETAVSSLQRALFERFAGLMNKSDVARVDSAGVLTCGVHCSTMLAHPSS